MSVLEDPHHGPERRREAEEIEDEGLQGHHDAAREQEQHDERNDADDAKGQRQLRHNGVLGVDKLGRAPRHKHPEGGRCRAHLVDQVLAGGRERLDAGDD